MYYAYHPTNEKFDQYHCDKPTGPTSRVYQDCSGVMTRTYVPVTFISTGQVCSANCADNSVSAPTANYVCGPGAYNPLDPWQAPWCVGPESNQCSLC